MSDKSRITLKADLSGFLVLTQTDLSKNVHSITMVYLSSSMSNRVVNPDKM